MNQVLLRERVIFDVWSRKSLEATHPDVEPTLDELVSKGFIDRRYKSPRLNEAGLQYVLHGRDASELVELLADVDVSEGEREFLAEAIKGVIDKPFAYRIISTVATNPEREKYPSVDLGAYDDIGHGMLFGAKTHIMIDPLIGQRTIDDVLQHLGSYGAIIREVHQQGNTTQVRYSIGDTERELYLVRTEAMKLGEVEPNLMRMVEGGIFSLSMKGRGGRKDDGFGNLLDAVEHYIPLLVEKGILLTGVPPKAELEKIGEGMLAYLVHTSQDYRLSSHGLHQMPAKG